MAYFRWSSVSLEYENKTGSAFLPPRGEGPREAEEQDQETQDGRLPEEPGAWASVPTSCVLARSPHLQAAGSKGTQQPPAARPGGLRDPPPSLFLFLSSVLSAQCSALRPRSPFCPGQEASRVPLLLDGCGFGMFVM